MILKDIRNWKWFIFKITLILFNIIAFQIFCVRLFAGHEMSAYISIGPISEQEQRPFISQTANGLSNYAWCNRKNANGPKIIQICSLRIGLIDI